MSKKSHVCQHCFEWDDIFVFSRVAPDVVIQKVECRECYKTIYSVYSFAEGMLKTSWEYSPEEVHKKWQT